MFFFVIFTWTDLIMRAKEWRRRAKEGDTWSTSPRLDKSEEFLASQANKNRIWTKCLRQNVFPGMGIKFDPFFFVFFLFFHGFLSPMYFSSFVIAFGCVFYFIERRGFILVKNAKNCLLNFVFYISSCALSFFQLFLLVFQHVFFPIIFALSWGFFFVKKIKMLYVKL